MLVSFKQGLNTLFQTGVPGARISKFRASFIPIDNLQHIEEDVSLVHGTGLCGGAHPDWRQYTGDTLIYAKSARGLRNVP
jgi:hypothetical protein